MSRVSLILASRSPRRAALLRDAGYAFAQADPPFADPPHAPDHGPRDPARAAAELAAKKAGSLAASHGFAESGRGETLVLSADTIVVNARGRWLGQPVDAFEARAMLGSLFGRSHRVVTGVGLLAVTDGQSGACSTFADTAVVRFGHLDPDVLERYLAGGGWRGKAGGYNLYEWRKTLPLNVTGDPTTVIGLPMRRLTVELARRGIEPRATETAPGEGKGAIGTARAGSGRGTRDRAEGP